MSALGDKKLEKMLQTFCALYLVPGASCHVAFRKCMNTYADGRSQKGVCFLDVSVFCLVCIMEAEAARS